VAIPPFPKIDLKQTVCAIATPIGRGGLGIVRLSGPNAVAIADSVFRGTDRKKLTDQPGYSVHHGLFVDPGSGAHVDEVLATVFRAPKSFTGEDSVEFSAHGGPVVLRSMLQILLAQGADHAAPGEFTLRAFLNGRIDLTEAEGVADIINAKTDEASAAALNQIQGNIKQAVTVLRNELISALARLEMGIDFTEEDLDATEIDSVGARLSTVRHRVTELLSGYNRGRILREGFTVVLAGPPNAGKSTLFNRLAQDERAIVTEIPGTTRDVLREYINIEGWPVCIVDTAGIREATDLVERIGVERSDAAIRAADGAIWIIDHALDWSSQKPPSVFATMTIPWLITVNKLDCADDPDAAVREVAAHHAPTFNPPPAVLGLSAKTGEGLESLARVLKSWIEAVGLPDKSVSIAINDRHRAALDRAGAALDRAIESLKSTGQLELAAFDAKSAADALGEVIGTTTTDEILAEIFSNFCVGK